MVLKLIEASDQRHLYIFRRPGAFIDLYFRSQTTNIIDKNKLKLVLYEHVFTTRRYDSDVSLWFR